MNSELHCPKSALSFTKNLSSSSKCFGWLIGFQSNGCVVLSSLKCLTFEENQTDLCFPNVGDEMHSMCEILCEGLQLVGYYCSFGEESDEQLTKHFSMLQQRIKQPLVACYFKVNDAIISSDPASFVKWMNAELGMMGKVSYDNSTIKNFKRQMTPVMLSAKIREGEKIALENVAILMANKVYRSEDLKKLNSISSCFPDFVDLNERGGLDFSKRLECVYLQESNNACIELSVVQKGDWKTEDRTFDATVVGYFSLQHPILDSVQTLVKRMNHLNCKKGSAFMFFQPQQLPFAVGSYVMENKTLGSDELCKRTQLSSSLFEARRDVKMIWKVPASNRLINVHDEILNDHGLKGAQMEMIEGYYEYCHYGQDVNDDGWGCAYRSLQTIVSWLRLQGYVMDDTPTHQKIQEALVRVNDKPKSFVGSKKWIGSIEIGLILNLWYELDCKIVSITCGSEVESKRDELIRHFREEKCPIMIGGGVLAWTLLGIAYTETETKYLILDPHYNGADERKAIQKKRWIGWQAESVFKKGTFYNFCCPLITK